MAFVFSCFAAIRALVETWSVQDVYSYGFFVPVMSLMWIWHEREKFSHLSIEPSLTGGTMVLLLGSLMLALGGVGRAAIVQELAIMVIIPGLVLTLLGKKILHAVSLPLAYLVLMVPVLNGLIDRLHWPFQLFAAATAVKLLAFFNIPVLRTGQFIELPNITLEVANACSGVRFLVSTMVLCVPLAFITQKSRVQRSLLFFLAVVIGVCSNPLRVTLVAAWAYYGHGDIHGPSHLFQGYAVYVIGMALLFIGAWLLRKLPFSNTVPCRKSERARPAESSDPNKFNRAWLVSFLMLLCLGSYPLVFKSEPVELKASLQKLPVTIGEWNDAGTIPDAGSFSIPGADAEIARVYRNASGKEVQLYVAYFESQRQDKKLVYYKLQMLYESSEELTILKGAHPVARVNKTVLRDGLRDPLILSWYDLNGRIVASRYKAKLMTAFNGLVHRRSNGAVVIVSSPTVPGGTEGAQRDAVSFVRDLLPVLDDLIP